MGQRKIIFFDIDGTLCAFGGQVPESTKEAIRLLKEKGHIPVVCTGRPRCTVFSEITDMGFPGIIAGAGTYIEYEGRVIEDRLLTREELQHALDFLEEIHMPVLLEGSRYMCYDMTRNMEMEFPVLKRMKKEAPGALRPITLEAEAGKMTVFLTDWELFKDRMDELSDFQSVIHYPKCIHAELLPKGVSKARGIETLLAHLGIPREDTYAFGDGPNDLEMLQYVEYGVAMGNGDPGIIQAAKYKAKRIDEDGIWESLKEFGLI
ncbi:MAG: Cof-type HAD-IIB family hydrolase [Lachnospiraceae bacterium]|nr:Cof-type HAD-IIB family hydrolase [Lachnospiraceae bacterium]